MTLDQARDRIAELQGWRKYANAQAWTRCNRPLSHLTTECGEDYSPNHPVPTDADGLLDLIEKAGYRWSRIFRAAPNKPGWWWAWSGKGWPCEVEDTGNRIHDLAFLLLAVLEAQQPNTRGDAT